MHIDTQFYDLLIILVLKYSINLLKVDNGDK